MKDIRPRFSSEVYAAILAAVQTIQDAIIYYATEDPYYFDMVIEGVDKQAIQDVLKDADLDGECKIVDEKYKDKETGIKITVYTLLP